MALPLLLGLAGSGLAGAGMLGSTLAASPLLAGALGSGLGSLAQGDDLQTAVGTGLLSYFGGKMLGPKLAGAGIGSTGADPVTVGGRELLTREAAGSGAQSLMGSAFSPEALAGAGTGLLANEIMRPPPTFDTQDDGPEAPEAKKAEREVLTPPVVYRPGIDPEFNFFRPMSEGGLAALPVPLRVMANRKMQEIYSEPLGMKFQYVDDKSAREAKKRFEETLLGKIFGGGSGKDMMGRRMALQATKEKFMEDYPAAAKRLGMAQGGLASLSYQEGGPTSLEERRIRAIMEGVQRQRTEDALNDKELISSVVNIIKSVDADSPEAQSDENMSILARFIAKYGKEALQDVVERVNSGEFDQNAMVDEGMLNGAGDGMDDMIPATLEGEQDVVLSDGEFIVPADVVSGLGNGSSDAGADALYEMMDRVRQMRTGMTEQPEQVPQDMMLPA